MDEPAKVTPIVDWAVLASSMDELRESLRAMVAGLVDDGFTEREARRMVARIVGGPEEEEEA